MKTHAAAKLFGDATALIAGTVAAIVSARYLGPAGKGVFSVLTYAAGLIAFLATLGLGDAAVYYTNRGTYSVGTMFRVALSVTAAVGVAGGLIGALAFRWYLTSRAGEDVTASVVVFAGLVPISALATVLLQLHYLAERFIFTSAVATAMSVVSAGFLWLALGPLEGGLVAAMVATLLTSVFGIVLAIGGHLRWPSDMRGRLRRAAVRSAVRYGAAIVAAAVLTSLAGRADLLVVHALLGDSDAGLYSVGLTVSTLPTYAAGAISLVGFPRQSRSSTDAFNELTAAMVRMSALAATLSTAVVAAATPIVIPSFFGEPFRPATQPTLLLLLGALPWAFQLVLGRSAAAGGRPTVLTRSYVASLLTMLALDLVLVPWLGLAGAALASSAAPLAGCIVLLRWWRSRSEEASLTLLIPGRRDMVALVRLPVDLIRSRAPDDDGSHTDLR